MHFFNLTFKNNIVKYEPAKLDKALVVRTPELLCGPQGDTRPSKGARRCCALVLGEFRHLVSCQTLCPHVAPPCSVTALSPLAAVSVLQGSQAFAGEFCSFPAPFSPPGWAVGLLSPDGGLLSLMLQNNLYFYLWSVLCLCIHRVTQPRQRRIFTR